MKVVIVLTMIMILDILGKIYAEEYHINILLIILLTAKFVCSSWLDYINYMNWIKWYLLNIYKLIIFCVNLIAK